MYSLLYFVIFHTRKNIIKAHSSTQVLILPTVLLQYRSSTQFRDEDVDARRGVHRASNFVFAYSFEFEIENGQYFNSTRVRRRRGLMIA